MPYTYLAGVAQPHWCLDETACFSSCPASITSFYSRANVKPFSTARCIGFAMSQRARCFRTTATQANAAQLQWDVQIHRRLQHLTKRPARDWSQCVRHMMKGSDGGKLVGVTAENSQHNTKACTTTLGSSRDENGDRLLWERLGSIPQDRAPET